MALIWKDIEGYEGLYQVSNYGTVRNIKTKEKKHLIPTTIGYYLVRLAKDEEVSMQPIHKLVAQHFIPNPNNLPYVIHLNNDLSDNRVINLEWSECTNVKKCDRLAWLKIKKAELPKPSITPRNPRANLDKKLKIFQYDLKGNFVRAWSSIKDIEAKTGYNRKHIDNCCKNLRKSSYGFKWEKRYV